MSGKLVIVQNGQEPIIANAVEYLRDRYGIPADDITAVRIDGNVGQPLEITVTVMVRADEPKMVVEFPKDVSQEEIDKFLKHYPRLPDD